MTPLRRFAPLAIAGAIALLLPLLPAAALATMRSDPVKLRLAGPPPELTAGEAATLRFELVAAREVAIEGLEVESRSLAAAFPRRATPLRATATLPAQFEVDVRAEASPEPLVIRWQVDGTPYQRTVDLRRLLAAERHGALALEGTDSDIPALRSPALDTGPAAEGPPRDPITEHNRQITVQGRFLYHRSDGVAMPVDGIRVRAIDQDDYAPDNWLEQGYTDANGYYTLTFYWAPSIWSGDYEPDIYVQFETESDEVTVQSTGLEIEYSWRTPTVWNFDGDVLDVGTVVPSGPAHVGALHILTTLRRFHRWYQNVRGIDVASVDVQWPETDDNSHYNRTFEEIHLNVDHTWSEFVAGHEYGHHYQWYYADVVGSDYCNGICDFDGCGHCVWCEEDWNTAFEEGWPNWIGHVQALSLETDYGVAAIEARSYESVETCGAAGFAGWHDTEGFTTTLLRDIWDSTNEIDPNGGGRPDTLSLGPHEIFEVLENDKPNTPVEFFDAFRARFPAHTVALWQTASNNRIYLDTDPPSPITGLTSNTHVIGVPSTNARIGLVWQPSTDDWSGVATYQLRIDRPDPQPDTIITSGPSTLALTYPLPPGDYTLSVRAVDRTSRTSGWASLGPYTILQAPPADLVFTYPGGWPRPVVPNSNAGATVNSVPYPTALNGNTNDTYVSYAFSNTGSLAGFGSAPSWLVLDGALLGGQFNGGIDPGTTSRVVNRGPYTVRGGRHYLGGALDLLYSWDEISETNNTWASGWIWDSPYIGGSGRLHRPSPPGAVDGWPYVTDPVALYYSCDGISYGAFFPWSVAYVAPDADDADYDARLHFTTSSVDTGFAVPRASSLRGPGCLELFVVNRRNVSHPYYDIGVTRWENHSAGYVVGNHISEPVSLGDSIAVFLPDSEYVRIFEIQLPAGLTQISLRATGDPADGPFRLAFLSYTFTVAGLSDPGFTSLDSGDDADLLTNVAVPAAGYYGIVLYRDPKHGRDARTIVLDIDPWRPDAKITDTPYGWASPLVPRPLGNGGLVNTPAPDTLHGNVAQTYLNFFAQNVGGNMSIPVPAPIELDGAPFTMRTMPALTHIAGAWWANETTPVTVPGGRHTISMRLDPDDILEEFNETNNEWGEQYVWSPLALAQGVPVTRGAPPDRTGGWSTVRNDSTLYFNCDGLRTPLLSNGPAEWGGIAVMPGAGAQLDLQLHEPAPGARAGFAQNLHVASWVPGEVNYVLMNFGATPRRVLDVGVVHAGGTTAGYGAEANSASRHGYPPGGVLGPFTLDAGSPFALVEVDLPVGAHRIRLLPAGGAAIDWGLSAHAPLPALQGKGDALTAAWEAGSGLGEEIVVQADSAAHYCFAVWKVTASDLASAAQFELEISDYVVDAAPGPPPGVTRLAGAAPSPFRGRTELAFDLATGGEVALEVFDLSGARVRTLASGFRPAGRHRIAWDGRAEGGRRLAPGVYLVRLGAGGRSWSGKVVMLE